MGGGGCSTGTLEGSSCDPRIRKIFKLFGLKGTQTNFTHIPLKQLKLPNQTTSHGLNTLSYIGPRLWNAIPISILCVNNVNSFKQKLKENFFEEIQRTDDRSYIFY